MNWTASGHGVGVLPRPPRTVGDNRCWWCGLPTADGVCIQRHPDYNHAYAVARGMVYNVKGHRETESREWRDVEERCRIHMPHGSVAGMDGCPED